MRSAVLRFAFGLCLVATPCALASHAAQAGDDEYTGVTVTVGSQVERIDRAAPPGPAGRVTRRAGAGPAARGSAEPRPKYVHGTDDRFQITDTTGYPYRTVCAFDVTFPNGLAYTATGILVGPSAALTAGHVVYSSEDGGWAETVIVSPGYDNGSEPFGHALATVMHSFPGWTQAGQQTDDMALVELDTPIGDATGWLGLWAAADADLLGATVNTAGYPVDIQDATGALHMWGADGAIVSVDGGDIFYDYHLDTYGGQSGSGLWIMQGATRFVVGVHAYGNLDSFNSGTRLTQQKLDLLNTWIVIPPKDADLSVASLGAQLPKWIDGGAPGTIAVQVDNTGVVGATAPLLLELVDTKGVARSLGTTNVTVGAGSSRTIDVPVTIPGGEWGDFVLRGTVNGLHEVKESDYADNIRTGPTLTVLPAALPLSFGKKSKDKLVPGSVVRYRMTVPAPRKTLSFKVSGKGARAFYRGPTGESGELLGSLKVQHPGVGAWEVYIVNPPLAAVTRTFKLIPKLSKK